MCVYEYMQALMYMNCYLKLHSVSIDYSIYLFLKVLVDISQTHSQGNKKSFFMWFFSISKKIFCTFWSSTDFGVAHWVYIYIYIYIYKKRESDRQTERDSERKWLLISHSY